MRFLTILLAALSLSGMVYAANSVVDIKVNGMVCDFCAQAVWKVFEDYEAVEKVDIDLNTGTVSVYMKDGMNLSDEELNKGITYAGYQLVSITKREAG